MVIFKSILWGIYGESMGIINGYINIYIYISGWWYTYPSEKNMNVNWDDDIPN